MSKTNQEITSASNSIKQASETAEKLADPETIVEETKEEEKKD